MPRACKDSAVARPPIPPPTIRIRIATSREDINGEPVSVLGEGGLKSYSALLVSPFSVLPSFRVGREARIYSYCPGLKPAPCT